MSINKILDQKQIFQSKLVRIENQMKEIEEMVNSVWAAKINLKN